MAIIRATGPLLLDMNAVTEKYQSSPQNMMSGCYPKTNCMDAVLIWFLLKKNKKSCLYCLYSIVIFCHVAQLRSKCRFRLIDSSASRKRLVSTRVTSCYSCGLVQTGAM